MGIGERGGHVAQHPHGLLDRELAAPGEASAKALAFHEWHRIVEEPGGLTRRVQRHDVRVLEPGGEPDLLAEAVDRDRVAQLRGEDLEDDGAVECSFGGDEDTRHAPAAELSLDGVQIAHRGLELRAQVRRRGSGCEGL
jgi:hypothetical protein